LPGTVCPAVAEVDVPELSTATATAADVPIAAHANAAAAIHRLLLVGSSLRDLGVVLDSGRSERVSWEVVAW
jgi:hypothetical protein